jgi:hypothetical protein
VEVILLNHLVQERWKRANRAMERANGAMERANGAMERANRAMERILIPLNWQTKGIYDLRVIAMSFAENL